MPKKKKKQKEKKKKEINGDKLLIFAFTKLY